MGKTSIDDSASISGRRMFGEIALEQKLITKEQLQEALFAQKELERLGLPEKLGNILQKKNWIREEAIGRVLSEQNRGRRLLGNFELYEKVGQGAMGVVFRARQISLDRIVALKILAPKYASDEMFIERFVREARAAGQFCHENIVTALDVGQAGSYHFLAMEYVEGQTLRHLLKKRGRLAEAEAIEYTRQIARALEHALRKNIIHRDVKPENVIVSNYRNVAKLLDMGLACAAGAGTATDELKKQKRITKTGKAVGTPHYMSPEAASGDDQIDTRADIYSLGCTFYHFLTGEPPFMDAEARSIMVKQISEAVPDVRIKNPEISDATAGVLAKMTAKKRDDRYDDPTRLLEDLDALIDGNEPIHARGCAHEKDSPTNGTVGRDSRTTGSRARGTTGPRRPIEPQGTTGPRRAIGPRTTGPRSPVAGDRTGGHGEIGPGRELATYRRGGSPGTTALVAAGATLVAILLGLLFWGGPASRQISKEKESRISPPSKPGETARVSDSKPLKTETAKAKPAASYQAERSKLALVALEQARARRQETPNAFALLTQAYEKAEQEARDTELQAQVEAEHTALRKDWEVAFQAALRKAQSASDECLAKGDFPNALKPFDHEMLEESLRAFDWQEKLKEQRGLVQQKANEYVNGLIQEGQAAATLGTLRDLETAILRTSEGSRLSPDLAESVPALRELIKKWEGQLGQKKAEEQNARRAVAEKGAQQMDDIRKELQPVLVQNRFRNAEDLLDKYRTDPSYQAAYSLIDSEKKDLQAILNLRAEALEALRERKGETVTLQLMGAAVRGRVQEDTQGQIGLKLPDGAVVPITGSQLAARDVDEMFPNEKGKEDGHALKTRGLLFGAAGDYQRAQTLFKAASAAGLEKDMQPYVARMETLRVGKIEVLAQEAWEQAEQAFATQKWKDALKQYEDIAKNHAFSEVFQSHKELMETRLAAIRLKLDPKRPGLFTEIYTGATYDPKNIIHRRSDATIDFDWKLGAAFEKGPLDNFGVRWTGLIKIEKEGTYTFASFADDGTRIWIDDKQILDQWVEHRALRAEAKQIALKPGYHRFRMEFFEAAGAAVCKLLWALEGGFKEQIVPQAVLFHEPVASALSK